MGYVWPRGFKEAVGQWEPTGVKAVGVYEKMKLKSTGDAMMDIVEKDVVKEIEWSGERTNNYEQGVTLDIV